MTAVQLARAVLLFYNAPEWDAAARAEWKALTGLDDATTKDLADLARKLLTETETPEKYLIWSVEHGGWWKPGGHGYTLNLAEAGRIPPNIALSVCAAALMGTGHRMGMMPELPVSEQDLEIINDTFSRMHPIVPKPWVEGDEA